MFHLELFEKGLISQDWLRLELILDEGSVEAGGLIQDLW